MGFGDFCQRLRGELVYSFRIISKLQTKVVCRRYQQAIDHMDEEGQKMAEEELRRMESRCIIRICLTGYGEEFDDKFIKDTNAWFEIKVKRYF